MLSATPFSSSDSCLTASSPSCMFVAHVWQHLLSHHLIGRPAKFNQCSEPDSLASQISQMSPNVLAFLLWKLLIHFGSSNKEGSNLIHWSRWMREDWWKFLLDPGSTYLLVAYSSQKSSILLGTNISPAKVFLKMIFLFPRWDMLLPWRVATQIIKK